MNPTTAEENKISDSALMGASAVAGAAWTLFWSPVAGLAFGLVMAAGLLALRRRMPTAREIVKVLAALAIAVLVAHLLADWDAFKQGIVQGFHRSGRP